MSGHCQPCLGQMDIVAGTKYLHWAEIQGEVPETVKAHYYESNCPLGVGIRENMRKVKVFFLRFSQEEKK